MMINRKGQGLTEYGIILLLVLLIGSFVYFTTDYSGSLVKTKNPMFFNEFYAAI